MWRVLLILSAAAALTTSCGPKKPRRQVAVPRPAGWTETGIASWYGHPYHGRAAANGEIYDMERMTAAHRTLPFETWVRVHNLTNDRVVDVRITDRGPFIDKRIIDLSKAAARSIEMIGPGTAKVRIHVLAAPAPFSGGAYAVQVGSFQEKRNADRLRAEMERRYGSARVVRRDADRSLWRVLVGSEDSLEKAAILAERIRREKHLRAAFVVRLDL
jgi:rare lipoprotein A